MIITKKNIDTMSKKFILLFFVLVSGHAVFAQDNDKVKFGAYGRALQQNTTLGEENDTLHADNVSKGHVLVDLGININPDKRTEVQAIIRMRSDIGGFYTAGSALQLRQLYIKGLIGKYFSYQVGDLYLQMSPYTFYNNNAEGSINEGRIFADFRRDYTNYENLSNKGNYWWQQGATTNFALAFKESKIDSMRVDAFFVRNRPNNYLSGAPAALFHAGGRVTLTSTDKMKLIGNYVNLFEIGKTADIDSVISNPVTSLQLDYTLWNNESTALRVVGEGGYSQLIFKGYETRASKDGSFGEGAVKLNLKPANLLISAGYSYVDPQFYSSAAQSKRVNFANIPSTFPNVGNDPLAAPRTANIFDLVKDTAVYNQRIVSQLMAYDPTLNNSQAYGKATPNRQGVNLDLQYKDSAQKVMANVNAAYLTEIVGVGTSEKRNFLVLKAGADFHIHKFINWKKKLIITTGVRHETTKRGGDPIQSVDLTSTLIDLGLEVEVVNRLDVLVGTKFLTATGNEFITLHNKYNDVSFSNANTANISVNQSLLAAGLKYRFSANTYLTVQDHIFAYTDGNNSVRNYSFNQFLIMFNMNF